MNISLPIELKKFIDLKVKKERFSSSSEYIRHLIRQEEKIHAENVLREEIMKGFTSGSKKYDPKVFESHLKSLNKK